mgnify:CR=1 FL=1
MLRSSAELELSREAVSKLRWIEYFLTHGASISLTARHFGIARSTFVRWACRFDVRDPYMLEEQSRCPNTVRQPETSDEVIAFIEGYRRGEHSISKERIRTKLFNERGIEISSATVGRAIQRNGFFFANTPAHIRKRRSALERGVRESFLTSAEPDVETPPEAVGGSVPFSSQFST